LPPHERWIPQGLTQPSDSPRSPGPYAPRPARQFDALPRARRVIAAIAATLRWPGAQRGSVSAHHPRKLPTRAPAKALIANRKLAPAGACGNPATGAFPSLHELCTDAEAFRLSSCWWAVGGPRCGRRENSLRWGSGGCADLRHRPRRHWAAGCTVPMLLGWRGGGSSSRIQARPGGKDNQRTTAAGAPLPLQAPGGARPGLAGPAATATSTVDGRNSSAEGVTPPWARLVGRSCFGRDGSGDESRRNPPWNPLALFAVEGCPCWIRRLIRSRELEWKASPCCASNSVSTHPKELSAQIQCSPASPPAASG